MSGAQPAVAVVVATRDRAPRLAALLESLGHQTLDHSAFEVVVVDDGSVDGTPELLEREGAGTELNLRTIRRSRSGGPAVARDEGWRAAGAPLVAFVDDDCVAASGWLDAGVRAAAREPGAIVQGMTLPNPAEAADGGPFSRSMLVDSLGPWYQTCNILYPRELLERLDGFDTGYPLPGGEDTDLAWRAFELGAAAVFEPEALVHHAVEQLGPVGKLRVAVRWTPAMRVFARHPDLRSDHLVHGVFWKGSHYLLVRALAALLVRRRARLLALWLGAPYVRHLLKRGRDEGGGAAAAPYHALHDLVELAAVARGAARYRTPVL